MGLENLIEKIQGIVCKSGDIFDALNNPDKVNNTRINNYEVLENIRKAAEINSDSLEKLLLVLPLAFATIYKFENRLKVKRFLKDADIDIKKIIADYDERMKFESEKVNNYQSKNKPENKLENKLQTSLTNIKNNLKNKWQNNWPEILSLSSVIPTYSYLFNRLLERFSEKGDVFSGSACIFYGLAAVSSYYAYELGQYVFASLEKSQMKGNLNYIAGSLFDKFGMKKASTKFYENYAKNSETSFSYRTLARNYFQLEQTKDALTELYNSMNAKTKSQLEMRLAKKHISLFRDLDIILLSRKNKLLLPENAGKLSDHYLFCSLVCENINLLDDSVFFANESLKSRQTPEAYIFKAMLHKKNSEHDEYLFEFTRALKLIEKDKKKFESLRSIGGHDVFEIANSPLLREAYVFKRLNLDEIALTKEFSEKIMQHGLDELGFGCINHIDNVKLKDDFAVFKYEKGETLFNANQRNVVKAAAFLGIFHAIMPLGLSKIKDFNFFRNYSERIREASIAFGAKKDILENSEACFSGMEQFGLVLNKDSHQNNWIVRKNEDYKSKQTGKRNEIDLDSEIIMLDIEDKGITDPASELAKLIYQAQEYNTDFVDEAISNYKESFNRHSKKDVWIKTAEKEIKALVLCRVPMKAISYFCFAEGNIYFRNQSIQFLNNGLQACEELKDQHADYFSRADMRRMEKTSEAIKHLLGMNRYD